MKILRNGEYIPELADIQNVIEIFFSHYEQSYGYNYPAEIKEKIISMQLDSQNPSKKYFERRESHKKMVKKMEKLNGNEINILYRICSPLHLNYGFVEDLIEQYKTNPTETENVIAKINELEKELKQSKRDQDKKINIKYISPDTDQADTDESFYYGYFREKRQNGNN